MKINELSIENIVVGTGAAGLQAALRLYQNGETDLAVVAENINAGTSRNTGSDKQTYYKLSLASGDLDSVRTWQKICLQDSAWMEIRRCVRRHYLSEVFSGLWNQAFLFLTPCMVNLWGIKQIMTEEGGPPALALILPNS